MSEHHHVVPVKVYLAVFLALCVFTVLTVSAAGQDFGALNTPIALVIAVMPRPDPVSLTQPARRLTTPTSANSFFIFLFVLDSI